MSVLLKTLDEFTKVNPDAVVTIENPTAMFRLHPLVVELTSRPDGSWRLIEVDYCKAAHPKFDSDRVFTKKPTDFIIFGVRCEELFNLPRCNLDCRTVFLITLVGQSSVFGLSASIENHHLAKSSNSARYGMLYHVYCFTLYSRNMNSGLPQDSVRLPW